MKKIIPLSIIIITIYNCNNKSKVITNKKHETISKKEYPIVESSDSTFLIDTSQIKVLSISNPSYLENNTTLGKYNCFSWRLSSYEIKCILSSSNQMSERNKHDLYSTLPCEIIVNLKINNEKAILIINAGSYFYLEIGKKSYLFGCDSLKYFLMRPDNEEDFENDEIEREDKWNQCISNIKWDDSFERKWKGKYSCNNGIDDIYKVNYCITIDENRFTYSAIGYQIADSAICCAYLDKDTLFLFPDFKSNKNEEFNKIKYPGIKIFKENNNYFLQSKHVYYWDEKMKKSFNNKIILVKKE